MTSTSRVNKLTDRLEKMLSQKANASIFVCRFCSNREIPEGNHKENGMSLKDQLDAQRAQSRERIPADTRILMDQGTEALRHSGIVDHSLKVGDRMPTFSLPNATGQTVNASDLLAKGPLVVTFYRGGW